MAVWHAGNTISNIISGFLAAGILQHMGGVAGLYRCVPLPRPPKRVAYVSEPLADRK